MSGQPGLPIGTLKSIKACPGKREALLGFDVGGSILEHPQPVAPSPDFDIRTLVGWYPMSQTLYLGGNALWERFFHVCWLFQIVFDLISVTVGAGLCFGALKWHRAF